MADAVDDELGSEYGHGGFDIIGTGRGMDVGRCLLHNRPDARVEIQRSDEIGFELEPDTTVIGQVEFHVQATRQVGIAQR